MSYTEIMKVENLIVFDVIGLVEIIRTFPFKMELIGVWWQN